MISKTNGVDLLSLALMLRAGGGGGGDAPSITVDDNLSTTSANPVQNKVITGAIGDIQDDVNALKDNVQFYGVCKTASNVAIKDVTIEGFPDVMTDGLIVRIFFEHGIRGTITPAKLNINNTGGYFIYIDGEVTSHYENEDIIASYTECVFVYDDNLEGWRLSAGLAGKALYAKAVANGAVDTAQLSTNVQNTITGKSDKSVINAVSDASAVISAADNNEYRCTVALTGLTLSYPENLASTAEYGSVIIFKTGSTAPAINYEQPLVITGTDCTTDTEDGEVVYLFDPQPSHSYIIGLIWDGSAMNAIVSGVEI